MFKVLKDVITRDEEENLEEHVVLLSDQNLIDALDRFDAFRTSSDEPEVSEMDALVLTNAGLRERVKTVWGNDGLKQMDRFTEQSFDVFRGKRAISPLQLVVLISGGLIAASLVALCFFMPAMDGFASVEGAAPNPEKVLSLDDRSPALPSIQLPVPEPKLEKEPPVPKLDIESPVHDFAEGSSTPVLIQGLVSASNEYYNTGIAGEIPVFNVAYSPRSEFLPGEQASEVGVTLAIADTVLSNPEPTVREGSRDSINGFWRPFRHGNSTKQIIAMPIVNPGDNLWSVSENLGVSPAVVLRVNQTLEAMDPTYDPKHLQINDAVFGISEGLNSNEPEITGVLLVRAESGLTDEALSCAMQPGLLLAWLKTGGVTHDRSCAALTSRTAFYKGTCSSEECRTVFRW